MTPANHPAKRDLTYEENNARVVWNSFKGRYFDRPCHGVADPGPYQAAAFRKTVTRLVVWLVALAALVALIRR